MQQVRAIHLILILRCRLLSCPLTKWRKPWAPNNSIWKRLWFSVPDGKMVNKAKAICQIQQMDHSNITKTTSVRSPFGSSPKRDRKKTAILQSSFGSEYLGGFQMNRSKLHISSHFIPTWLFKKVKIYFKKNKTHTNSTSNIFHDSFSQRQTLK